MDNPALKIKTEQDCRQWLAQLPLTNAQLAQTALSAQIKMLNTATVAPSARLKIMESLRSPVAFVQAERAKRFFNQPVPLDEPAAAGWSEVIALWDAMVQAYESCVGVDAVYMPQIYQRALEYAGLAMRDHNRIYRAIPAPRWQRFHALYSAVEATPHAATPVADAVGDDVPDASCTATYLRVLLLQHATPDALTLAQLTATERWLRQWTSLVTFVKTPGTDATIPRLAVLFGTGGGARDVADVQPAPNVRYLELDRLGAMLVQMIAGLRNGKSPADLALGAELRQPACENLLLLLTMQWCGTGKGRTEERSPSSIKVMVSMSIAAMHFHLTGRAFRQPGARLSKREEDDMQMFGRVSERTEQALLSQRSGALETWEIINHSRSGMLGMCRQPDAATRLSHNQLLGLRTATGRTFYLGVVQRIQVDESGAVAIGLRVIPGLPTPIAAKIHGVIAADGKYYDRALLMSPDEARKTPPSLIMAPASYQPNRKVDIHVDAAQEIRLTAVLDKGVNFERVTYEVV